MSPVSGAKMSPSSQVSKARDAAKSEARELSSVGVLSADRAPARPPRRPSCSKVGPRIGTSVKALDGRSSPFHLTEAKNTMWCGAVWMAGPQGVVVRRAILVLHDDLAIDQPSHA